MLNITKVDEGTYTQTFLVTEGPDEWTLKAVVCGLFAEERWNVILFDGIIGQVQRSTDDPDPEAYEARQWIDPWRGDWTFEGALLEILDRWLAA